MRAYQDDQPPHRRSLRRSMGSCSALHIACGCSHRKFMKEKDPLSRTLIHTLLSFRSISIYASSKNEDAFVYLYQIVLLQQQLAWLSFSILLTSKHVLVPKADAPLFSLIPCPLSSPIFDSMALHPPTRQQRNFVTLILLQVKRPCFPENQMLHD